MKYYGIDFVNQRGESEYVVFVVSAEADIYIAEKEFKKKYNPYWVKRIMRLR